MTLIGRYPPPFRDIRWDLSNSAFPRTVFKCTSPAALESAQIPARLTSSAAGFNFAHSAGGLPTAARHLSVITSPSRSAGSLVPTLMASRRRRASRWPLHAAFWKRGGFAIHN